jgi:ATP-dependent DNA ligase
LVGPHARDIPIQFSKSLQGRGAVILEAACGMELEGTVSKKLSSRYRSGRQTSWLKAKYYEEGDFVVIGTKHEPGKPAFALLARETTSGQEYAGSAFLTPAGGERDRFREVIEHSGLRKSPLQMEKRRSARWVEPELRVRVQHLKGRGKLRHAMVREILP